MNKVVIDSSALIAYLVGEEGADKVEPYLEHSICMSTANWAEVISKVSDWGKDLDDLSALLVEGGLIGGTLELFPLTVEDAKIVGELRAQTKAHGLSLCDRACLALALRLQLPVITADRSWSRLKLGCAIKVIR